MRRWMLLLLVLAATPLAADEDGIIDCVFPPLEPCIVEPETEWDFPSCEDYELDRLLIASAENGDRSALLMLEERYAKAFTFKQRHAIARTLLGRVADDRAIWNELATHAHDALRFLEDEEALEAFCEERGCLPSQYESVLRHAFEAASLDRRSRPLLLRALASDDEELVFDAIAGLGAMRDESSLSEIEKVLERLPAEASTLAMALSCFRSERADALARQHLGNEYEWQQYLDARD